MMRTVILNPGRFENAGPIGAKQQVKLFPLSENDEARDDG